MTYFVILGDDPRKVWHYIRREWCSDWDAEYGRGFEYSSFDAASRRAGIVAADSTPGTTVSVVSRKQLFEMLDVKDWAGPSR